MEAERGDQRTGSEDCEQSTHHGRHDSTPGDDASSPAAMTTMTMTMITINGPPNRPTTNTTRAPALTHSRRGTWRVPFIKQTPANTPVAPLSSCAGFATSSYISAVSTFNNSTATAAWPSSTTTKFSTTTLACPLTRPARLPNTSRPANSHYSSQRIDFPKNSDWAPRKTRGFPRKKGGLPYG